MDALPKIDFTNLGGSQYVGEFTSGIKDASNRVVEKIDFGLIGTILEIVLTLYSIFFICIIIYSIIRIKEINASNKGQMENKVEKYALLHKGR